MPRPVANPPNPWLSEHREWIGAPPPARLEGRDFANPVGIITKSVLIRRDLDLLAALARQGLVRVSVSIPFLEDDMARAIEPYAPAPSDRF
ncbi:MAG: hypothetical protein ACHQ1G_14105, partial [Planctomycetota bacterium]